MRVTPIPYIWPIPRLPAGAHFTRAADAHALASIGPLTLYCPGYVAELQKVPGNPGPTQPYVDTPCCHVLHQ